MLGEGVHERSHLGGIGKMGVGGVAAHNPVPAFQLQSETSDGQCAVYVVIRGARLSFRVLESVAIVAAQTEP